MVQHARDVDEIEIDTRKQGGDLFEASLTKGQVVEPVLVLEVRLVGQAGRAQVDSDDSRPRVVEGVSGASVGTASRDQNIQVIAVGLIWPEREVVGSRVPAIPSPAGLGSAEVRDRKRIDPLFVLL